jgi:hypothetical protein
MWLVMRQSFVIFSERPAALPAILKNIDNYQ